MRSSIALHVFVAMPYGIKEGVDFNCVYAELIRPALEAEGFQVFRADEEERAGDIRTDMFQELLLADVVIADLSIDNANVWYELGVRHALRGRGVIPIACRQGAMPFDVYTDRKLCYHIKQGIPDPEYVQGDRNALAAMVHQTVAAWHGRKSSPVYHLLPYLKEPDWKTLRVGGAQELWQKQEEWERRLASARAKQRPGDVMVLAEEAPAQALRQEAYLIAAKTLRQLNQPAFALEQVNKALGLDPQSLPARHEQGILLGRLKRFDEAKEWIKAVAQDHPLDAETCGLLGRVEKDLWVSSWRKPDAAVDVMREDARLEVESLDEAVSAYVAGFRHDPRHYYSGINALSLLHLRRCLTGADEDSELRIEIEGGVRWALRAALSKETSQFKDFWARVSLAELELLLGDRQSVESAYAHAVAAAAKDRFALDSSWQQLNLLQALGFRPEEVNSAKKIVERALARLMPPFAPNNIYLFSGHMIDASDREFRRFPVQLEARAGAEIAGKLAELGAGPQDVALCQGACGGDLLFAEAALARHMRIELRLPFDEPKFIEHSVAFAGPDWVDRYYKIRSSGCTQVLLMADELGPAPANRDPYERANVWQLYSALAGGPERVRFLGLWDGEKSGRPGGTDHMIEAVRKRLGRVYIIDTKALLRETCD